MDTWHKIESDLIVDTERAEKAPQDIATGDDGNPVWRIEVQDPQPAYDPVTQESTAVTIIEPAQVRQSWNTSEKDLADARKSARAYLTQYFRDYDQSQFTAAQKTFSANSENTTQYFKLAAFVTGWPANTPPVEPYDPPQVVIDIDGNAMEFTTQAEFFAFWQKFENLNQEARDTTWTAWKNVQGATTNQEIRDILAALPPIPGTV